MIVIETRPLTPGAVEEAAGVVAREHAVARTRRPGLPAAYLDAQHCGDVLEELLDDGFEGLTAHDGDRCVGLMCGRIFGDVAFFPAHGMAVDPHAPDPTSIVVSLFAKAAQTFLDHGALRFTIDHIDRDELGIALYDTGFARGSLFGIQRARKTEPTVDVDIRIGTREDVDVIAELSHLEFAHRSSPPIYAPPQPRTLRDTRALHEGMLDAGSVHFLARRGDRYIGLVTVEFTSPAPRLCPTGEPYIGPTAVHPSARGQGVGVALVNRVLHWAYGEGHHTVSVDFDTSNPLSRPFWLARGFEPTGYRVRRTIDSRYAAPRR